MSQELIEQTFTVSGQARMVIYNVRGSVVVQAGQPGTISVQAVKHTGSGSHTEVTITQDADGTVHAEARHKEGMLSFMTFTKPCKVDFTVSVPPETDLSTSLVSSSLDVSGLRGVVELSTVSGNIELSDLAGKLKINTVSGDISAAQLAGSLTLESVSGDVHLDNSNLGSAKVKTVSGDVQLHTPLGEGPYHFNSVSGDVRLVTLPEAQCTLELSTISGRINSSLPQTASQRSSRSQTMEIQGGGVRVYLRSVSGNLIITSSAEEPFPTSPEPARPAVEPQPPAAPEPAAPEPVVPPTPVPPVEPRLTTSEILEKIERGEMSVDEGLKLINEQ